MGLFSTHHYHHTRTKTELVPYEKTVIEKRAPTDESIKLFDEYLEKAKDRIVSTFKVTNSFIEGILVIFSTQHRLSPMPSGVEYIFKFRMNGKDFKLNFEIDPIEMEEISSSLRHGYKSPQEQDRLMFEKIFEKVSKLITLEMLSSIKTTDLGLTKDYKLR